jgi:hypothetical protein
MHDVTTPRRPDEQATEALRLLPVDAARAEEMATAALSSADGSDPVSEAVATRVLGLAARQRDDYPAALDLLRRSLDIAEAHGLASEASEARLQLVPTLALTGDAASALREAALAAPHLRGRDLARLRLHEANVLLIEGRLDDALARYRAALPGLRRAGDEHNEADLLNNRAMVCAGRGSLGSAEADLRRALSIYERLDGEERMAANVRQNLGFVAARRGDLPAALHWFDEADEYFRAHGLVDAVGLRDRCEALLPARLVAEARRAAGAAVDQLTLEGRASYLAEARLMLAQAILLEGDAGAAQDAADDAARAFAAQRRHSWLALARLLSVRAAWLGGERSPGLLHAARRAADALEATGWAVHALDARLIAAQVALGLGRTRTARRELARAAGARRRGPVELRVRAWHAEALLRLADGNRRGAEHALRAGVQALDRHRAALGATELRVHASAHGADLARLGLELALADQRPERVLAWAERWRAGCLHLRPVRPPEEGALAAELVELRRIVGEVDAAALAGRDTGALLARQAAVEESVRHRARHTAAAGLAPVPSGPTLDRLVPFLGERALVEIVEADGELHAVTIAGGRIRLRRLGPLADVRAELESLRFALRRMAFPRGTAASLAAAASASGHAARRLDSLLLEPVAVDIGDRPLVLVPTAELHTLSWSTLPSCTGRAVTVAPSAALWLRAAGAAPSPAGGHVVLAAGPGLPNAATEVTALARQYPDALRFTGRRATVAAVMDALDGAELAHVAAHGHFRRDNPLFSCLRLADGPLTVYDLERLRHAPRSLILSACDSALSEVRPGDEVMGLAAAVFSLGTRTLLASVIPVPDDATRQLMVGLHRRLRRGEAPADALAAVQCETTSADPAASAASAGFVCFGAGW